MKKRDKCLIRASVREMAANEITGHIGNDRYQAIKLSDEHPFFFGATVAHEGVSRGKIAGQGSREKHWPDTAITSLTQKLNESAAPVFLGHGGGDRASYGSVVSAFSENGQAQAVSYIQDSDGRNKDLARRIREGELNTVSIEADLVLQAEDDRLTVVQVEQVTGLALGDSRWERPGFAGARVLAAVQEFADNDNDDLEHQPEGKEVKLQDIIAAIREGGYTPQQIFQASDLLAAEPVKTALGTAQQATEQAKAEAKKAGEDKAALEKTQQELSGKLAGFESQGLKAERIKAAKLTEKTAQYVESQMSGFTPQGDTPEARQAAIDEAIKGHKTTFDKFFSGGKSDTAAPAGGGATDSETGETPDPADMADPKVNPFIPGSTAKVA